MDSPDDPAAELSGDYNELQELEHACCLSTFPEPGKLARCVQPHLDELECLHVSCGGAVDPFWVCWGDSATR